MSKPKSHKIAEYSLIALQHVFVSNVWLDPIYVATAGGLSLAYSSNLVNTIFIVSRAWSPFYRSLVLSNFRLFKVLLLLLMP